MEVPKRYAEEIRQIPGVKHVAYASWFGAKYPKDKDAFFGSIAVEPEDILKVYDEIIVPPSQLRPGRKTAAACSSAMPSQQSTAGRWATSSCLQGTIYPGDWEFEVSGIYTSKRATVDRSTVWLQWKYVNESRPPRMQDQVGWIMARVNKAGDAATIAKAIDRKFEDRDIQTAQHGRARFPGFVLGHALDDPRRHVVLELRDPRHHRAHRREHDRHGRARTHAGVRRAPRDRLSAEARRGVHPGRESRARRDRRTRSAWASPTCSSTSCSVRSSSKTWAPISRSSV